MPKTFVLHPEIFDRTPIFGSRQRTLLERRCEELASGVGDAHDPNVSVLIRTHNDADDLVGLFEDLKAQEFNGRIEVVVVDTESTDATLDVAKQNGAKIVHLKQKDFDYPTSLNMGFEAATHPFVFTLVGHSRLTSRLALRTATRWSSVEQFGGAFGSCLPSTNATGAERFGSLLLRGLRRPAFQISRVKMGVMSANCSLVSRKAWQTLHGYDKAYGAGGEDTELARRMVDAGFKIFNEPVVSVYHSHGLSVVGLLKQYLYWFKLDRPSRFDATALRRYRKDLE
ncbi:MAG TPA: glycosyltransferase [Candidatus Saccharimonadales bacterium]